MAAAGADAGAVAKAATKSGGGDAFVIAGRAFASRLLLGSSLYPDFLTLRRSVEAARPAMVTVALRRVSLGEEGENLLDVLHGDWLRLPNTAGCFTARDAVLTAQMAREALETDWVKLEVIGDRDTLLPDMEELLKAARILVKDGFVVLPYCSDDPVLCRRLAEVGCAAVMPLAAPIGSGLGVRNPHNLALIGAACSVPVIVDAGLGAPSEAAYVMELGADGVLVNSAVARARAPVVMARAMRLAVEAGRAAFLAGRMARRSHASATTPFQGVAVFT